MFCWIRSFTKVYLWICTYLQTRFYCTTLACTNISYTYRIINQYISDMISIQVNLDMTDSMGPGKLVRHMQNPSYTYDKYLICIGLGPSISSVICENPSYSGPSYPSSPVQILEHLHFSAGMQFLH